MKVQTWHKVKEQGKKTSIYKVFPSDEPTRESVLYHIC